MWLFLATEIMMFGGLFASYGIFRSWYPDVWVVGSNELDYKIGAVNTIVLLISSFTMALSVYYAQTSNKKGLIWGLIGTLFFGGIFLVIKYFEYSAKWNYGLVPGFNWDPAPHGPAAGQVHPGHLQIFMFLYFAMTGLHAFHMLIGFIGLIILLVMAGRNKLHSDRYMPVELFGFYWHLVDIVWVFLYPLLYLVDLNVG